jgi:hypothetical protein
MRKIAQWLTVPPNDCLPANCRYVFRLNTDILTGSAPANRPADELAVAYDKFIGKTWGKVKSILDAACNKT